jgi:taurine dioxygenase
VEVEPIAGALGAIVHGVDLRHLDDEATLQIHRAWLDHQVLFFRDQDLDPASHTAFARRFGELELHPLTEKLDPDHPEVTLLHSDRGGRADVWHHDVPFSATPPKAAVLRYIRGPARGGDTMWSNQYLAYASMSAAMQAFLVGLTAINTAWSQGRPDFAQEHPVVRVHPETGRHSLYATRLFTTSIPQLHPSESAALLAQLFAWAERPEFTCRWRWRDGDVAMWDNRCTMHYAIGDYTEERIMQRVTIIGDPPVGAATPGARYAELPLSAASALHRRGAVA